MRDGAHSINRERHFAAGLGVCSLQECFSALSTFPASLITSVAPPQLLCKQNLETRGMPLLPGDGPPDSEQDCENGHVWGRRPAGELG